MTTIIVPEKQTMYCMHGIVLPPVVFKLSEYIPVARVVAALNGKTKTSKFGGTNHDR